VGAIFNGLMFVVNFFGGPSTFLMLFALALVVFAFGVHQFYKQATHQSMPASTTDLVEPALLATVAEVSQPSSDCSCKG
jgi:hypothetical protein